MKLVLAGTISLALLNKVKAALEKENQSQCHDGIWYSRAGNSWSRSLLLIDRICLLVVVVWLINQTKETASSSCPSGESIYPCTVFCIEPFVPAP